MPDRLAQRSHGRLSLITQNVDSLDQRADSHEANSMLGSIVQDRLQGTPQPWCSGTRWRADNPPRYPVCGNLRRLAVVWFGEYLLLLASGVRGHRQPGSDRT